MDKELREKIALAMSRHNVVIDSLFQEILIIFNQWLEEKGAEHKVDKFRHGYSVIAYEPLRLEVKDEAKT